MLTGWQQASKGRPDGRPGENDGAEEHAEPDHESNQRAEDGLNLAGFMGGIAADGYIDGHQDHL